MAENSSNLLYVTKSSLGMSNSEYLAQCNQGLSPATKLNHFLLKVFCRRDKSIDVFYTDGLSIFHKKIETVLRGAEMFLAMEKGYHPIEICISGQLRVDIHRYAEQVYKRYYPCDPRMLQTNFAVAFYAVKHIMREMTDLEGVHWVDGQGDSIEELQALNVSHLMLYLKKGHGY